LYRGHRDPRSLSRGARDPLARPRWLNGQGSHGHACTHGSPADHTGGDGGARGRTGRGPTGPEAHWEGTCGVVLAGDGPVAVKSAVAELGSCREEEVAGGVSDHPRPIPSTRKLPKTRRSFGACRRSRGGAERRRKATAMAATLGTRGEEKQRGRERRRRGTVGERREEGGAGRPYPRRAERRRASLRHRAAMGAPRSCFTTPRKKITAHFANSPLGFGTFSGSF
jgi:hypothetical protein